MQRAALHAQDIHYQQTYMYLPDNSEFLKGNKETDLVHVLNTPTLQIILDQTLSDIAELSIFIVPELEEEENNMIKTFISGIWL